MPMLIAIQYLSGCTAKVGTDGEVAFVITTGTVLQWKSREWIIKMLCKLQVLVWRGGTKSLPSKAMFNLETERFFWEQRGCCLVSYFLLRHISNILSKRSKKEIYKQNLDLLKSFFFFLKPFQLYNWSLTLCFPEHAVSFFMLAFIQ